MDEGMVDQGGCSLVNALIYLFGWGLLSLPNVLWLANCAIEAGANDEELTVLATLGSSGKYAGNMRRDFGSSLCPRATSSATIIGCSLHLRYFRSGNGITSGYPQSTRGPRKSVAILQG